MLRVKGEKTEYMTSVSLGSLLTPGWKVPMWAACPPTESPGESEVQIGRDAHDNLWWLPAKSKRSLQQCSLSPQVSGKHREINGYLVLRGLSSHKVYRVSVCSSYICLKFSMDERNVYLYKFGQVCKSQGSDTEHKCDPLKRKVCFVLSQHPQPPYLPGKPARLR